MKAELDVEDLLRNDGYTDVLYNHHGNTTRSPASVSRSNTSNQHTQTHVTNHRGFVPLLSRILAGALQPLLRTSLRCDRTLTGKAFPDKTLTVTQLHTLYTYLGTFLMRGTLFCLCSNEGGSAIG